MIEVVAASSAPFSIVSLPPRRRRPEKSFGVQCIEKYLAKGIVYGTEIAFEQLVDRTKLTLDFMIVLDDK